MHRAQGQETQRLISALPGARYKPIFSGAQFLSKVKEMSSISVYTTFLGDVQNSELNKKKKKNHMMRELFPFKFSFWSQKKMGQGAVSTFKSLLA